RPVGPEARNLRSTSTTRPAFRRARWQATLAPCTPPPTTTTSAVPGTSGIGRLPGDIMHHELTAVPARWLNTRHAPRRPRAHRRQDRDPGCAVPHRLRAGDPR